MKKRLSKLMLCCVVLLALGLFTGLGAVAQPTPMPTIDPTTIPQFVNQLPILPVWAPTVVRDPRTGKVTERKYTVAGVQLRQQILPPGLPKTTVWGYAGYVKGSYGSVYYQASPGAVFDEVRHVTAKVHWENKLTGVHPLPIDPTIHWANPNNMPMPMPPFLPFPPGYPLAQYPITFVTHLHGGEDRSDSDGHPEAWYTANGLRGPTFITDEYTYPNNQNPTTLWYHDHSLGITRLNVQMGLAGMYLIRDPQNPLDNDCSPLPRGKYEIPLLLQDHTFNIDGSIFFPNVGNNPDIHPYWNPEFFGTVNTVNGKVWPNLNVERRQYRFRIVNANNARFMNLFLSNGMSFTQIGSDGGYLPKPVELTSILMGVAERIDILIDFSKVAPGSKIILQNDAPAPFPSGDEPFNPATNGVVMQFTVGCGPAVTPKPLPAVLNTITPLTPDTPRRILTLFEVVNEANGEPLMVTLDGQRWHNAPSETPRVGSTQDWNIINLTDDAHPIHLHLIQFQVINRQQIDRAAYTAAWLAVNGQPPFEDRPTIPVDPDPFLIGPPVPPPPEEQGWKDTIKVLPDSVAPGAITRIRVRIAPQDAAPAVAKPGVNLFSFDPTFGPGYVWHCHILDHEDNEMMRPFIMVE